MSAHKSIDKICIVITAAAVILAFLFCNGQAFGVQTAAHAIGYENRLFDRSRIHTIDIVMNDWDSFIAGCENEEYSACNLAIDGEAVRNAGLRAKGNTSLSSVRNMDSDRYSFKIEFDQYETGKTYHGLDKLCLNNIIQDNTYMKDYLAYTLMYDFGVDAPLCSYAYLTVNGEDWGLYLAVEAIEDSFLKRNYGINSGDLYKPDAMGFGGGRGNGKDFSMGNFMKQNSDSQEAADPESGSSRSGGMPDFGKMPAFGGEMPGFGGDMPQFDPKNMPSDFGDFDPFKMFGADGEMPDFGSGERRGGFGMGSDDVKLKYTDDDPDSYSRIFSNAKTPVDQADQKRLIRSLKALLEQSDLESTVDTEEVIRYFVVHNFLVNGDSYTGQMVHNYYLYEEDGQLSMIPWDYNLAFGSFMGGNASSSVNSPIDTPVSNGMSDRPMIAWIFGSEEYTAQYHQLFSEFIDSVDFEKLVSDTAALIDKYVEKDPTKFCTYDAFKTGVEAIRKFCTLREESVSGQLNGTIPATSEGQKADSAALIDTNGLNTSDMGSMGGFGGGKGGFGRSEKSGQSALSKDKEKPAFVLTSDGSFSAGMLRNVQMLANEEQSDPGRRSARGSGGNPGFGGQPPQGFGAGMPDNFDPDNMPDFGGQPPQGFDPDNMPADFDPEKMPGFFSPFEGAEKAADDTDDAGTAGQTAEPDEAAPSDSNSGAAPGQRPVGGERPGMGGFSPMNGAPQQNNTEAYILLSVSALVLLLGLGFALKFKR